MENSTIIGDMLKAYKSNTVFSQTEIFINLCHLLFIIYSKEYVRDNVLKPDGKLSEIHLILSPEISLEGLSEKFFINKLAISGLFKKLSGTTMKIS